MLVAESSPIHYPLRQETLHKAGIGTKLCMKHQSLNCIYVPIPNILNVVYFV